VKRRVIDDVYITETEQDYLSEVVIHLFKKFDNFKSIKENYSIVDLKLGYNPKGDLFFTHYLGQEKGYRLFINMGSKELWKFANKYESNPESLIPQLEDIHRYKRRGFSVFAPPSLRYMDRFNFALSNYATGLAYRNILQKIFEDYESGDKRFLGNFDKLTIPEQKSVIKKIFATCENPENLVSSPSLDWLLDNHEPLVREVSEEKISGKNINQIKSLLKQDKIAQSVYEFELLGKPDQFDIISQHMKGEPYEKDSINEKFEHYLKKHHADGYHTALSLEKPEENDNFYRLFPEASSFSSRTGKGKYLPDTLLQESEKDIIDLVNKDIERIGESHCMYDSIQCIVQLHQMAEYSRPDLALRLKPMILAPLINDLEKNITIQKNEQQES